MKDKKSTEEMIDMMSKAKCQWPVMHSEEGTDPVCNKDQFLTVSVPILELGSGTMVPTEAALGVPVCQYHACLAMSGMFGLEKNEEGARWHGPFDVVHLVESVINSMLISGRFDKIKSEIEKSEFVEGDDEEEQ